MVYELVVIDGSYIYSVHMYIYIVMVAESQCCADPRCNMVPDWDSWSTGRRPGSCPGGATGCHLLVEPQLVTQVDHGHDLAESCWVPILAVQIADLNHKGHETTNTTEHWGDNFYKFSVDQLIVDLVLNYALDSVVERCFSVSCVRINIFYVG